MPLVRLGLVLLVLGAALAALFGALGFLHPALDLFNHGQPLWLAALVLGAGFALLVCRGRTLAALVAISVLGFGAGSVQVAPVLLAGLAARPALPDDGRPVLELFTHNLFGLNYDMDRVAAVIAAEDPDIVAVQEYFAEQREALHGILAAHYPYSAHCAGGKRANIGLYSKLPFEQAATGTCSESAAGGGRVARILGRFTLSDGTRFSVMTTHLDWPLPLARQQAEMAELAEAVRSSEGPLLLVGDFNSTPWSFALSRLAAEGGLARQTHGNPTYPLLFYYLGDWRPTLPFLAIDQVMTRGPVAVHALHAGAPTGSDHLPVVLRFSVTR